MGFALSREHFVDGRAVVLVPDLLKPAPGELLVRFRHKGPPVRAKNSMGRCVTVDKPILLNRYLNAGREQSPRASAGVIHFAHLARSPITICKPRRGERGGFACNLGMARRLR